MTAMAGCAAAYRSGREKQQRAIFVRACWMTSGIAATLCSCQAVASSHARARSSLKAFHLASRWS